MLDAEVKRSGGSSPAHAFRHAGAILFFALSLVAPAIATEPADPGAQPAPSIGNIDEPPQAVLTAQSAVFSGWALNRAGVERIELVVDGRRRFPALLGIKRDDVATAHPGYPNNGAAGFEAALDLGQLSAGHHDIDVVVTDSTGATTTLGRKTWLPEAFRNMWAALLSARGRRPNDTFYFVFATSNVREYGGSGIDKEYNPYLSDTVRFGARVPILYLRTTRGSAHDWVFDEDFDTSIKCGERHIAEDSLNAVMRWSIARQVPVLFTLNGGIWADSSCNVPEWDVNDHLEEDVANCQWNERNEVMADDYLRNLPGSQEAPELARTLTLNVHATAVRTYKKRNLQHAARLIREFADRNPHLFIGISLDPDVTINPFFEGNQWYDYNPGTLRQFREWLRGTGPYAKNRPDGETDLHAYRRLKPFTLAGINRIAGTRFKSWDQVDPPRVFKRENGTLRSPWNTIWEQFRRHLVDVHYDDLSRWVGEMGIDRDRIFSSQGFNAPSAIIGYEPFPLRIESGPKGYDTGGVSVQGAVPAHGHLGAILYGDSAENMIPMEGRDSLFQVFRDFDPDWAAVEYNTAHLNQPRQPAGIAQSYRSIRDVMNFGARLVSPMAWNGSTGEQIGQPGFVSYTAYRGTPLETAARTFMLKRANLPRQARYWGFGSGVLIDDDDWEAVWPATAQPRDEGLELSFARGAASLESPPNLNFTTDQLDLLVLGLRNPSPDLKIAIHARARGTDRWRRMIEAVPVASLQRLHAGYLLPLPRTKGQIQQLRLVFSSHQAQGIAIDQIVLYPVDARMPADR